MKILCLGGSHDGYRCEVDLRKVKLYGMVVLPVRDLSVFTTAYSSSKPPKAELPFPEENYILRIMFESSVEGRFGTHLLIHGDISEYKIIEKLFGGYVGDFDPYWRNRK